MNSRFYILFPSDVKICDLSHLLMYLTGNTGRVFMYDKFYYNTAFTGFIYILCLKGNVFLRKPGNLGKTAKD